MSIRKTIATALVLGGGLVGITSVMAGDHNHLHAEIGKPAPPIELPGIDGKTYKMSDFKGKIVVVEWTNHECPFVKRAHDAKQMTGTHAKFKDQGVVWLAVDSSHFCADKADAIKTFAKDRGINYPILLDPSGQVGHAYGAKTTPHMFVIDQKGNLAYMGAMDNEFEAHGDGSRKYVEEAVKALLTGSTVPIARTQSHGCSVKYRK